jgi:hypothetical protein
MKERKSLIPNERAEAWMPLISLCRIYEIPYSTGLKWVKNNQVKSDKFGDRWFVEVGSFAYRNYGVICECSTCHKKWWSRINKDFCSHKCELSHNLLKSQTLSQSRLERYLNVIKPQSFGLMVRAIRYRKHISKSTFSMTTGISWDRLKLIEAEKIPPPSDKPTLKNILSWLGVPDYSELYDQLIRLAQEDAQRIPTPQLIIHATCQKLHAHQWVASATGKPLIEAVGRDRESARVNLQTVYQRHIDSLLASGKAIPGMGKGYTQLSIYVEVSHEV